MKFCIKCASMYMVIRNEVKVMLFRLSAPRIFDQDCSSLRFKYRIFCIEYIIIKLNYHVIKTKLMRHNKIVWT
jgi:hypothetical protein